MAIGDSHVFADGDTDYIENLNNIRGEAVAIATKINSATGAATLGDITATSVVAGITSKVSTESVRAHKTGTNTGGINSVPVMRVTNDSKTAGDSIGLHFGGLTSTDANVNYAGFKAIINSPTNGSSSGHLGIFTTASGSLTEAARITSGKALLINTTTDDGTSKLQVSGQSYLNGNVGVGTSSPFSASGTNLEISSAVGARCWLTYTGAGSSRWYTAVDNTQAYRFVDFTSGASVERMRITTAGNVLVGTTTDDGTNKLQVAGSAAVTGNLSLSGNARRITCDFSNATPSNRTAFQTSTTDGVTVVSAIPNGTATQGIYRVWNTSGFTTGATGSFGASTSAIYIDSGIVGAGTNLPIQFQQLGTARGSLFISGRWFFGSSPTDDGSSTVNVNGVTKTLGLTSVSPTVGVGYGTGAGSTVTQATSKSTGVTLNNVCGSITMHAASLAANSVVSFTLTNSNIAATDVVNVIIKSGATADSYIVNAESPGAGTCKIVLRNMTAGALAEAVVITFIVFKAVSA